MSAKSTALLLTTVTSAAISAAAVLTMVLVPATAAPAEQASAGPSAPADTSLKAAASRALDAYSDWTTAHRDEARDAAGLTLAGAALLIQWKGQPPEGLADALAPYDGAVRFQAVRYSADDIAQAGREISSTGLLPDGTMTRPDADYAGVVVELPPGTPIDAIHISDRTASGVPIRVVEGTHSFIPASLRSAS